MARPASPQHFVLDEETHSASSATESLLGRPHSPTASRHHPYPPSATDDEKRGRTPRRREPGASATMHGSAHVAVRIPTSTEVANARLQPRARPKHWRVVAGGLVLLLGAAYFVTWLLSLGTRFGGQPRMQVILMISDGMGPASETMARSYVQHLASTNSSASAFTRSLLNESLWANLELGYKGRAEGAGRLPLDDILVGTSRTRSSNSLVTDSAAGATAFSCGLKTFNGAIGVTPALAPCGTLLEAAHRQGFATGLVATSRITHATPASFYAHVPDRDLESEIAAFLVGEAGTGLAGPAPVDFAFGGGRCFFVPQGEDGSCRTDETDLLKKARDKGFRVLEGMAALRDFKEEDEDDREGTIIGLFASDHMDYEIDRQGETTLAREQPSLRDMATVALRHLSRAGQKGKGKGFFLMIEGSRIDMAGHNNDPVAHISDMLAYQSTVQYVQQWVDDQNEMGNPTMLISVSDHETGGLALGRQLGEEYPEYLWYPDALANATHSTPYLGDRLASEYPSATRDWVVSELFEKGLGITDATSEEVDRVWQQRQDAYRANRALADAISRRAQVGWSTAGHSGVDVNLYAFGHNSTGLTGNVENTDIGEHIAHNMGLNLEVVTVELSKSRDRWFDPKAGKEANRTTGLAHYHGDL